MLSCAVKRRRGWLCTESFLIFFCYPCSLCFPLLDVTKITWLCPKLNIPTQWLVVRCVSDTNMPSRQFSPNACLKEIQTWCADESAPKKSHFFYSVWTCLKISGCHDYPYINYKLVMRAVKHTHTLFLSFSFSKQIHPVRPCPKRGAVNHAVNVQALKSTITEDLDWII